MFVAKDVPAQKANGLAPRGAGQTKVLVVGSLFRSYQRVIDYVGDGEKGEKRVSGPNNNRGRQLTRSLGRLLEQLRWIG